MSLKTYKLRRKYDLAFGLEATTGTAATLAGADAVTRIFNGHCEFNTEIVDREQQGSTLSPILQGLGARAAALEFETELNNGASGVPIWSRLFKGCGYSLSGSTFTPLTGPVQTLTFQQWIDGVCKTVVGAMGTAVITIRRGVAARIKWSFTGVQDVIADVAMPTPTYINTVAPRAGAATFTIGGTNFQVDQLEIDLGNVVVLREDISAVDSVAAPTGYLCACIPNRKPVIRFAPEATSVATKDWDGVFRASTTAAMNCVIGAAANQTFTITAPALQQIQHPKDADRQALYTKQLEFICTGSAGDDELQIALS